MPTTESGLIVPEGGLSLPPGVEKTEAPEDETQEERQVRMASQLPTPTGYKILVALPVVSEVTEGGIYKAQQAMSIEEVATVCGYVIAVGPDAYGDDKRFPSGPYCEPGGWVVFRAFSGTRIKVHGQEFRLLNDDSVEATVEDPQGVERA